MDPTWTPGRAARRVSIRPRRISAGTGSGSCASSGSSSAFRASARSREHAADMRGCAAWLAHHLRAIGLEGVRVWDTAGHPVVCGHWLRAAGRPTVLIYGHYDVQPADPPRRVVEPSVRAGRARRSAVRPRRRRRQGTDVRPPQGDRVVAAHERRAAGQREVPARGRGRDRQPASRGVSRRASCRWPRPTRRSCPTCASGEPDAPSLTESLRGALSLELTVSRTEDAICTRATSAARSQQSAAGAVRDRRRAPGSRAAGSRSPASTIACAISRRTSAPRWPPPVRRIATSSPTQATTWSWGEPGYTALRADDHPAGADGHGGSRRPLRGAASRRSFRRAHPRCSTSVSPRIRIPPRSTGCAVASSPASSRRRSTVSRAHAVQRAAGLDVARQHGGAGRARARIAPGSGARRRSSGSAARFRSCTCSSGGCASRR